MFFDDAELSKTSRIRLAELPRTPETNWRPPASYPSLNNLAAVGFDCEVEERDFEHGPGWSRGKAAICGGSLDLLYRDGSTYTEYRPTRHTVDTYLNLDHGNTVRFWKDVLELPVPKFGANLIYDVGNMQDEGINVKGELHDCQFSEALLDEESLVDLDTLGFKYLKEGKQSEQLYEWCAKAYGGNPTSAQRDNIYRASPKLVGPYGETDASHPRRILMAQWRQLQQEQLTDLYRLECDLIPLYVAMRRQGVRVDVKRAEQIYNRLGPEIRTLYKRVKEISGVNATATTGGDIKKIMGALNIHGPLTENNNESFNKEWLSQLDHPIADVILEIRKMETVRNTFLYNYILKGNTNGIIHCEFHPLRNDEGGTRTGRLSSSNPNLQNIPVRTTLGKEIRKCFLPFEGHACWHKGDFSQIQYRALAHYAVGPGSDELRAEYIRKPDTDYHDRTQTMVKQYVGIAIPRKPIKNLNFGIMFGAGKNKVKRMMQLDSDEIITDKQSETFYVSYHSANPYVKATLDDMAQEASTRGYITSLLGRRTHFNKWEPVDNWTEKKPALDFRRAVEEYGQVKRAGSHKAISGRLQGAEADIMKSAMRKAMQDGVYDVTGVPTITVHDEKGFSVIDESPRQNEAYKYMHWVMENTLTMRVPILYAADRGPTWGDID